MRLIRFGLRFPPWNDEAFLALNVIRRDYAGLTQGLDTTQVAPIGYLWSSRAVLDVLGTDEFTLRLTALAAGIVALLGFRWLASMLLRGTAQVAAVAIFAVAYYPLRHAVEMKPYSCDLAAAVLLLVAGVAWRRRPTARRMAALAATIAVCLPFSYPAVFVAGGVCSAVLFDVVRRRDPREAAMFALVGVVLAATFAGVFWLAVQGQWSRTGGNMQWHWSDGFPPSPTSPLKLLAWFVEAHAGEALAYPFGSQAPACLPQAIFVVVGIVALGRRKSTFLPLAFGGMLLAAFVAAVLKRYPYGYGERVQQHWAPFVCLLMGVGVAALLARIGEVRRRRQVVRSAGCLLAATAILLPTIDFAKPYKYRFDRNHQEFARWFWRFAGEGRPLVCLGRDLGRHFFDPFTEIQYHVLRSIYRRAPYDGGRDGFASIPRGSPIVCVIGTYEHYRPEPSALAAWSAAMEKVYLPPKRETYFLKNDRGESMVYYVWKFDPRTPTAHLSDVELPSSAEWSGKKSDGE